jgi:hypothetical protein
MNLQMKQNGNFTEFKTTNCLGTAVTHLKSCPIVAILFDTLNLYFLRVGTFLFNHEGMSQSICQEAEFPTSAITHPVKLILGHVYV